MKNAINFLQGQFQGAHDLLTNTLADLTPQQAHYSAGAKTVPIVAHFGHVVVSEDMIVNGLLKHGTPLFASAPTGFSELPPQQPPWDEWGRRVKVDLKQANTYAQQVYAATNAYIASLEDDALAQPLDLTALGLGMQTVGFMLGGLVLNVYLHTGEISCLKGLQGLKGYPI